MHSFKEKCFGALDLFFLFGRGITAFSADKNQALRSLIIPILFLLIGVVISFYYGPYGLRGVLDNKSICLIVFTKALLHLILSLGVMYGVARFLKSPPFFYHYLHAANYVSIFTGLLAVIFALLGILELIDFTALDRIFVIFICYFTIIDACIIFKSYKMDWTFAGALAILNFGIGQTLWDIIFFLLNIPQPW